jgi:hypothetical protein
LNALPFFINIKNALSAGGTGGLSWHIHAYRSQARWQLIKDEIHNQLMKTLQRGKESEQPNSEDRSLVLIGASAGWMMSSKWLCHFKRIDFYDIDPFAPYLFRMNHARALKAAGCEVHFHTLDAIRYLDQVLGAHPNAFIWFDNVLGQHRVRLKSAELANAQLKILTLRLRGRAWGSLHDLYSGPSALRSSATSGAPPQTLSVVRLDQLADAKARVRLSSAEMSLEQAQQKYLQMLGATRQLGAWFDHETSHLFPSQTPLVWMGWEFKPGYYHCLEFGWVSGRH